MDMGILRVWYYAGREVSSPYICPHRGVLRRAGKWGSMGNVKGISRANWTRVSVFGVYVHHWTCWSTSDGCWFR